jgi:RNA polymerase sigma-70 factor, ECF subfamily
MHSLSATERQGTDEVLMVRYQRGEEVALTELVERHKKVVYSVASLLVDNPEAACALSRDTFLELARNAGSFHIEHAFRPWLFGFFHRLVVNRRLGADVATDSISGHLASPPPLAADELREVAPPSSRSARSPLLTKRVRDRVLALPVETRETLLLKLVAELSTREIALTTGDTPEEVSSRLRQALEQVQSAICDTEDYARALR